LLSLRTDAFPRAPRRTSPACRSSAGADGATSTYAKLHDDIHACFRQIVDKHGYYDYFLIDLDGNIVYSVTKEADSATNLVGGPVADTGLGKVFRTAMDDPGHSAFTDIAPYAPSADDPASFAARVVTDAAGRPLGAIAIQLSMGQLDNLLQDSIDLGETGES
jgi:methyl-accepting chemotaxis protein